MSISVITPSLPTRTGMLAECIASVARQTHKAREHLIAVDQNRLGPSTMRNSLLKGAAGDWVAVLDDDDLFLPKHLETLMAAKGDVIYSWCKIEGRGDWNPNRNFVAAHLREGNYIPATALIRTELLRDVGGWRNHDECRGGLEDWDLWIRLLDAGAEFTCLTDITWIYRFHGGNRTDMKEWAR